MRGLIIVGILQICLAGCCTFTEQEIEMRHKGIVDACYTVLEHAPEDKDTRINEYLEKQKEKKVLTAREKVLIKDCLDRTERSPRWQKGK